MGRRPGDPEGAGTGLAENDPGDAFELAADLFDQRSAKLVGATAAGLEAMLATRETGGRPHPEASKFLVDQIRRELADVARVVLD